MHARPRWTRLAWLAAGLAMLGGVFALYAQPGFIVMMIDQIWACF